VSDSGGQARLSTALRESVADDTAWRAIVELYFEDKVEEAFALIQRTGAGEAGAYLEWNRMIEAEAVSRRGSIRVEVATYLTVEYPPDEVAGLMERHLPAILKACDRVSRSLAFTHGPPVLLAFLSEAANAPWAVHPYGYCMDMVPYEKICIPTNLIGRHKELVETVAHEYAHVATLNLTKGRAPAWLEEAVSMQFESEEDVETLGAFLSEEAPWLRADELTYAFGSQDEQEVWDAYQQSKWIGRYLRLVGGDDSLGHLLRSIGSDSLWPGIWARVLGRTGDEQGLRMVYGKGTIAIFTEALGWLKEGRPNDPGPFPD
jgi:hypothetical protein